MLYYFGNELEYGEIDLTKIMEKGDEEEWRERVEGVRRRIEKGCREFEERMKKVNPDDDEEG